MVDRRRTWCWFRASGVQRAALAGVVLWSNHSIIDWQITGFGGLAGACVVVGKISGRGNGVGGLSGWVVVGCGVIVVIVGCVVAGGRGGGSELSVLELMCVVFLGVECVMLEGGGGGGIEFKGVGGEEGAVAVVLALVAAASALGRSWPSSSHCHGPFEYVRQAFIVVLESRWEVSFLGVLGGRLVGSVFGMGLASTTSAASAPSGGVPGGRRTRLQTHS